MPAVGEYIIQSREAKGGSRNSSQFVSRVPKQAHP